MGGHFKTKQTALLLVQHLLAEQNCTDLQLMEFLPPRLVGKPEQSEFPCYVPP